MLSNLMNNGEYELPEGWENKHDKKDTGTDKAESKGVGGRDTDSGRTSSGKGRSGSRDGRSTDSLQHQTGDGNDAGKEKEYSSRMADNRAAAIDSALKNLSKKADATFVRLDPKREDSSHAFIRGVAKNLGLKVVFFTSDIPRFNGVTPHSILKFYKISLVTMRS